jgi:hypothetical protein
MPLPVLSPQLPCGVQASITFPCLCIASRPVGLGAIVARSALCGAHIHPKLDHVSINGSFLLIEHTIRCFTSARTLCNPTPSSHLRHFPSLLFFTHAPRLPCLLFVGYRARGADKSGIKSVHQGLVSVLAVEHHADQHISLRTLLDSCS